MENENLKVFKVCGEYRMSEDDNFKIAKNISLSSALKILNDEVKNFLRDNFKNLDDNDIFEIIKKFVKTDEPRFVRENLPDNEMICYAYVDAEINLDDLNNFLKNFDVIKLEKKIGEMQKMIDELEKKFELYHKNIPLLLDATMLIMNDCDAEAYYCRGSIYYDLKNYSQAILDFTKAIKLRSDFEEAYNNRGNCYEQLGENEKAEKDFAKARQLGMEWK